jgi:hypothetical protein
MSWRRVRVAMHLRNERIEHCYLVAVRQEGVDEVRADEAGPPGHECSHGY